KKIEYDIKLVEAKTFGNLLVVSGLKGFYIYDCGVPYNPKIVFTYKHAKYREYQGFDFIKKDEKLFVAFTLFGEGLEIWNVTDPRNSIAICHIPIDKKMTDGNNLPHAQSMDIVINYTYLYATLGPLIETFNTKKDRRGILIYYISNMDSVKKNVVLIPEVDWYRKKTGDKQPTYITKYKKKLYVNFAEKGIAIFNIDDPVYPQYQGTEDISGEGAVIQPVFASNGRLYAGSYYWPTVYTYEIN